MDRLVPVLVKKDLAYFQIQEIVFHFSILLRAAMATLGSSRTV